MLLKCVYPSALIWNDGFTEQIDAILRGGIVLGLGEERKPSGNAQRYSKVFYRGNIGWISQSALEEVTEPLEESRASK